MTEKHWAVFALRDIRNALDQKRYDVATCHINDAIAAIMARDQQDVECMGQESDEADGQLRHRI